MKRPKLASSPAKIRRRNQLVDAHVHMIYSIAKNVARTLPPSIDIEDLEQQGALGLLAAAAQFDPRRRVPFAAYARLRIRGAMLDWARTAWRHATADPIAPNLADDCVPVDERLIEAETHAALSAAREKLSDRQRQVIELRFDQGSTQRAAGKSLGISQEGARQLQIRAVRRLKQDLAA